MKEFWDARYSDKEYAYGTLPNQFFKESIDRIDKTGKLLLPAEGEGRNAIYAAKLGWEVFAFDISKSGKQKADQLAKSAEVSIHYEVGGLDNVSFHHQTFDAAAFIFAHFPPTLMQHLHSKIAEMIVPGGLVILEGFSKAHIEMQHLYPNVGGPKNVDMLFSFEQIKQDFMGFEVLHLSEMEIDLAEGKYHQGRAKVIQLVGRKPE